MEFGQQRLVILFRQRSVFNSFEDAQAPVFAWSAIEHAGDALHAMPIGFAGSLGSRNICHGMIHWSDHAIFGY